MYKISFIKRIIILLFSIITFTQSIDLTTDLIKKCDNSNNDNSSLDIKDFNVSVDPSSNTLSTKLNVQVKQPLDSATAVLTLSIFGNDAVNVPINLCNSPVGGKICPIPTGTVNLPYEVELPSAASKIVQTLTKIPGANLSVRLRIVDANNNDLGCVAVNLSKPVSGQQPALIGAFGGIAALSAVVSVISSVAGVSSLLALPLGMTYQIRPGPSPSFFDVIQSFQFMATTGMLNLNYPALFQEFTTNMGWSMGIVNVAAFQNAINNFRGVSSSSNTQNNTNLVRRALDFLPDKDAKTYSDISGVNSYASKLKVQPENYFMTVLIIFACLMGIVTVLILLLRLILEMLALYKPKLFKDLRNYYANYYIGNIIRVFFLTYFFLATAALFQLTLKDYLPITIIAGVVLGLFCVLLMAIITFLIIKAGPKRLYSEPKLGYTYGALYSDYRQPTYLFFVIVIITSFIRACAVGVLGKYPWVQLGILVGVEILFFLAVFLLKPYASRIGNTLMIFIGVIRVANLGLLFFYIQSIVLPDLARTIIAVAMIVLQGIIMLAITLLTLWGLVTTIRKLVKGEKIQDEPISNDFEAQRNLDQQPPIPLNTEPAYDEERNLNRHSNNTHGFNLEKKHEGEPLMMDYYRSKSPQQPYHQHKTSNPRSLNYNEETNKEPFDEIILSKEPNFNKVEGQSQVKGLKQQDLLLP